MTAPVRPPKSRRSVRRLAQALEQIERTTWTARRRRAGRRRAHPRHEDVLEEVHYWDQVDQAEEASGYQHVPSSFELSRDEMSSRAHDCPNPTVLHDRTRPVGKRLVCLPCGKWTCESCGPKRQAEFTRRMMVGFVALMEERASLGDVCEEYPHEMTWTFRLGDLPGGRGSQAQMDAARGCVNRAKRAIAEYRRRQGLPKLVYCKVWEYQENGTLHVHYIVIGNPWPVTVPHRLRNDLEEKVPRHRPLLKARGLYLAQFGLGFIHSWNPAKGSTIQRLVRYLSGYIVKSCEQELPKHCPRYSSSRGLVMSLRDWRTMRAHHPELLDDEKSVEAVGVPEAVVRVEGRFWLQDDWKAFTEAVRRRVAYLRWRDLQLAAGVELSDLAHDPPGGSLGYVGQMS